jgi:hypothetical protein
LNVTRRIVVKAAPGRLNKLVIINGGTGSAFTLHDCATLADAAAANAIFVLPPGATVGTIINLDWPMQVGITLSAVPDGGVLAVSFSQYAIMLSRKGDGQCSSPRPLIGVIFSHLRPSFDGGTARRPGHPVRLSEVVAYGLPNAF